MSIGSAPDEKKTGIWFSCTDRARSLHIFLYVVGTVIKANVSDRSLKERKFIGSVRLMARRSKSGKLYLYFTLDRRIVPELYISIYLPLPLPPSLSLINDRIVKKLFFQFNCGSYRCLFVCCMCSCMFVLCMCIVCMYSARIEDRREPRNQGLRVRYHACFWLVWVRLWYVRLNRCA